MTPRRPLRQGWDSPATRGDDEDAWLMTYLDVFTLLLVMMVVLLAFAQPTPEERGRPTHEEAPAGFLQTLTHEMQRAGNPLDDLRAEELGPDVEVLVEGRAVRFRINAQVLFDPGQAQLMGTGLDVLDRLTPVFQKARSHHVVVEGHTIRSPSRPSGSPPTGSCRPRVPPRWCATWWRAG